MRDEINSKAPAEGNDGEGRKLISRHPSRSLLPRARGYGIGGGYERPYRKRAAPAADHLESYGPLPHSGYYGAGEGARPFREGQAGFGNELPWYGAQYGERTSGCENTTRHHQSDS